MTPPDDRRVYVPHAEGVTARVKTDYGKEYCYLKHPGEEYFHLLVAGEVYVQRGHEKFCLNCALAEGLLTTDRIHWQRRESMTTRASTPGDDETFAIKEAEAESNDNE